MQAVDPIRKVVVTRYIQALREGGSLPGLVEADDGFMYVIKFRGAGQGRKALVAELIGGEIARKLGFKVPEIVFAELDEAFGRQEPDEEIQDLLKGSVGENLGVHFLSGAVTFDAVVNEVDEGLASRIAWLDAYLFNVDRTARNTNMLVWNKELWLIDHGAALFFHHSWDNWQDYIHKPFSQIRDHVLLSRAGRIVEADELFKELLTPEVIRGIVSLIPDEWLENDGDGRTAQEKKDVYEQFLAERLENTSVFINAVLHAKG